MKNVYGIGLISEMQLHTSCIEQHQATCPPQKVSSHLFHTFTSPIQDRTLVLNSNLISIYFNQFLSVSETHKRNNILQTLLSFILLRIIFMTLTHALVIEIRVFILRNGALLQEYVTISINLLPPIIWISRVHLILCQCV